MLMKTNLQTRASPSTMTGEPSQWDYSARSGPETLIFSSRSIALRLFFTCWLVYTLHFATNTVREIYLALGIGDHFSFRVDEYAHMHPDLFEKEGYGWHIGNNPGASMLAAIPYALARPVIDPIVKLVQQQACRSRPDRTAVVRFTVAHGARILRRSMEARVRYQVWSGGFRDAGVLHGSCLGAGSRRHVFFAAAHFPVR